MALGCAENDARDPEGRGNIDDRFRSRRTDGITKQRCDIFRFAFGFSEDLAGLGIFLSNDRRGLVGKRVFC